MFDGISLGLSIIANLGVGVINVFEFIGQVAINNWSIIEPILIAVAIYFITLIIPALWDTITTLAAMAIGWMMVNWPIMLVIGSIALFIYIMMQCGVTAEQVVGFIGGCFGVLFAFIYNKIAFVWNGFASLAEFLANVFNHPLYSMQALFANIWNNIVSFVGSALDSIVGMVKKIPFLSDLIGDFSSSSLKIDIGPPPEDYWTAPKMEMKDYGNEFNYGYSKGAGLVSGIKDMFGGLGTVPNPNKMVANNDQINAWNAAQGPGTLAMAPDKNKLGKHAKGAHDHLKNIDDKMDVSNEHLQMLRDLAEQESIQNFTTLSPSVQITTGDIKEEADISKIISKIESYMEEELANSAEGLYA